MRVFNLNADRAAAYLIDFFEEHEPDIILLQEWANHIIDRSDSTSSHFNEYEFVAATRYVLTASHSKAEVAYSDERTLMTIHDGMLIVNTYLDASSGKLRREHLEGLCEIIDSLNHQPALIAGDFNMAPRPEDGWYGDDYSKFTSKGERTAFGNLLSQFNLQDKGEHQEWEATFERLNRGKMNRFRCDLALVSENVAGMWILKYDHNFRKKSGMSDHSALILQYEV